MSKYYVCINCSKRRTKGKMRPISSQWMKDYFLSLGFILENQCICQGCNAKLSTAKKKDRIFTMFSKQSKAISKKDNKSNLNLAFFDELTDERCLG